MSEILEESGDAGSGRVTFGKLCASCHRLDSVGSDVGPNLQPLRSRGAAFMLTNILNPNREIDPRYESYTVVTTDGQVVSGILAGETASSVSLLEADGKETRVRRSDIDQMKATGRSLMPEGIEQDLTRRELVNLIAYLVQPTNESQVNDP